MLSCTFEMEGDPDRVVGGGASTELQCLWGCEGTAKWWVVDPYVVGVHLGAGLW